MKEDIQEVVYKSLQAIDPKIDPKDYPIEVDVPKRKEFGDFATNIAFLLARDLGRNPRDIADMIIQNIPREEKKLFKKVEIAGAGFINFYIKEHAIINKLIDIEKHGESYGNCDIGDGEKVLLEFVSANPTGYLHMGHARNACVGDSVCKILSAVGYDVTREFYINDAGRQMDLLGLSVYRRYEQFFGIDNDIGEDGYHGEYIKEIASRIREENGQELLAEGNKQNDSIEYCKEYAKNILLDEIRKDLNDIGVTFDKWYSEKDELYKILKENGQENLIERIKNELSEKGALDKREGAIWFKASEFGDSQDWVIVKKDGSYTYFISDIAYHYDKVKRGYKRLINVWGADHHSHISRLQAALRALGPDDYLLEVLLIQFVRLLSKGREISMSKRSGTYVTMRDVLKDVGRDVTRFFLIMRSSDSHLDFDLDSAKDQSSENPVYYVQYAHARIGSIFEKAKEKNLFPSNNSLNFLDLPDEIDIAKKLLQFPEVINESAQALAPHKIAFYLQELASGFHIYYNKHRIIVEDPRLSSARLFLIGCIKTVIAKGLGLLGVSAPDRM
ncbi:arginine--tRNA ligase [Desulfobacterota bacterium AH_259_B03_O07]|nr:arginine--tRNA ligase [Desulfobacterota bacterium AH_259_B03_O07]